MSDPAALRASWLDARPPARHAAQRPCGRRTRRIDGMFDGLDADGALRLRLADGAGRVSFTPATSRWREARHLQASAARGWRHAARHRCRQHQRRLRAVRRWQAGRSARAGGSPPIRAAPPTNMPSGCTNCSSSKASPRPTSTRVIIATVVPRALHNLEVLAQQIFRQSSRWSPGEGAATGRSRSTSTSPASVGADRALNAIAAHARHPGDLIVIDFGTATTFDVVDFIRRLQGRDHRAGDQPPRRAGRRRRQAAAHRDRGARQRQRHRPQHRGPDADRRLLGLCRDDRGADRAAARPRSAGPPRSSPPAASPSCSTEHDGLFDAVEPDLTIHGLALLARGGARMIPGEDELLFLALGGSGEIGMNVNLYGSAGKWLMVDLGMTFADPTIPGVDLILPDLEFIEERPRPARRDRPDPRARGPYRRDPLSRRRPRRAALRDAVHRRADRRQAGGGGADRQVKLNDHRARRGDRPRPVPGHLRRRSPTRSPRAMAC